MIHRLLLVGLLITMTGCQGVVGPLERRCLRSPVDVPCLPADEQEMRLRERLALPEQSPTVGPPTDADLPSRRGVSRP